MKTKAHSVGLLIAALAGSAGAQDQPPGTEIYLVDLTDLSAPPVNLTRRPGYDNQPFFSADGREIYYTRIENGQADIYRYSLDTADTRPVLQSADSEYSPTLMPGGQALSVIRVEPDQRQRLWSIPLDGSAPTVIFPNLEPVGYHAWTRPGIAALFVLGEPHTLQLTDADGNARVVAENIGRAIVANPARPGAIAFVAKTESGPWTLNELDTSSGAVESLIDTLPEREDFTIAPGGAYWMGKDSNLYCWRPGANGWQAMADFSSQGIVNITRLAIDSGGRLLAIVAEESEAP